MTPEHFERQLSETKQALRETQGELSSLRASCYALDALLTELGFPSGEKDESRFGFDAARRVSLLRADLLGKVDRLERRSTSNNEAWGKLTAAIYQEPEWTIQMNAVTRDVCATAIAVLERLRKETTTVLAMGRPPRK